MKTLEISQLFACPVCESGRFQSLFEKSGADLVQCEDCGLRFIPSPLPEVSTIYKASYAHGDSTTHGYQSYDNDHTSLQMTYAEWIKNAEKWSGGKGRLLDMGCTLGLFGFTAKQQGWDVFVTDMSEFAVMKAVNDFQLKGFVSPVGKLPVKSGSFDLITLYGVLHHTNQPLELLSHILSRLTPGGVLHLTTPNMDSFSAKLLKRRWFHFKPEEHLVYFDPKTLNRVLSKAGFEILDVRPLTKYMTVGELLIWIRPYAKRFFDFILKLVKYLRLDKYPLRMRTGEIEAFARLSTVAKAARSKELNSNLDVFCCPKCEGELLLQFPEVVCQKCHASYDIENGVINFSKYAKAA